MRLAQKPSCITALPSLLPTNYSQPKMVRMLGQLQVERIDQIALRLQAHTGAGSAERVQWQEQAANWRTEVFLWLVMQLT